MDANEKLRALIDRLRPGVECAPWVIEELKALAPEQPEPQGGGAVDEAAIAEILRGHLYAEEGRRDEWGYSRGPTVAGITDAAKALIAALKEHNDDR